jgi:hypothetical protein
VTVDYHLWDVCCVVWQVSINVSEELVASIFRVEDACNLDMEAESSSAKLHSVTSQKTVIFS